MTKTQVKAVLRVLEDGVPRSANEIIQATGLPDDAKGNILQYLRKQGLIESEPVTYRITNNGATHLNKKPNAGSLRVMSWRKAKREAEHAAQCRSIPNSVFALGGMA